MFLEEHQAKELLTRTSIAVPRGSVIRSSAEAARVTRELDKPVVLKAQVPTGKRGRAGLIRFAKNPEAAGEEAKDLLGTSFDGYTVEQALVEEQHSIARELYAAVINDTRHKCPLMLFSNEGGMDIEEIHATSPDAILSLPLEIRKELGRTELRSFLAGSPLEEPLREKVADVLGDLYTLYQNLDAELVEINPLAVTASGQLVALDCKLVVDDSALRRHPDLPRAKPRGTALELRAKEEGLLYLELDGDVGVLANGAGLTMSTMDAITFYQGKPANFMEIGGDAYKKASTALSIVLGNPRVKSLLVNLCGAFARTDVMVEGFLAGWRALGPRIPVAFSIHGTGEERAIRMVRDELGIEPHEQMDDAVKAAIRMAAGKGD